MYTEELLCLSHRWADTRQNDGHVIDKETCKLVPSQGGDLLLTCEKCGLEVNFTKVREAYDHRA